MPAILTFEAKWEPDSIYYKGTKAVCPAKITHRQQASIHDTALAAYRLLDCSGYARVDMRMDKKGDFNVIEVNPNPDISPEAGAARQAAAAGMSYVRFIETITKLALERKRHGGKDTAHERRRQTGADKHSETYA
jgi:D-alanine-D-alanine ligase